MSGQNNFLEKPEPSFDIGRKSQMKLANFEIVCLQKLVI